MKTGFVVGKFYPPHRGHKHLIEQARRQVDRLVVMIAAHPSQSIPGELRKAWLEEIHPDCDVRLVPDELGDDHRAWADFTTRFLGEVPDIVFSSEDYGPEFARFMGAEHVMIDRDRRAVPISATAIRASPLEHLDFLEPSVRAHFVKRVALIGAESTGKTTLAERLAAHFETVWVPEFAREHWERKLTGYSLDSPPPAWSREEFVEIAATQQKNENAAAGRANRVLFVDTNAFATGTWFERYNHARDVEVDEIGSRDKVDLYLHTAPDIPFVQDGVRDGEAIRDWMDRRFTEQLNERGIPVVRLEGAPDDRFRVAVAAVEALLGTPSDQWAARTFAERLDNVHRMKDSGPKPATHLPPQEVDAIVLAIERPHPDLWTYYLISSLTFLFLFPIAALIMRFKFQTLRYKFTSEGISMSWGILFRRETIINYARIQDIHLRSNLVERWLGLGRILVQTASGNSGAEMTIEGVKEFELVRDFLYSRMRGVTERPSAVRSHGSDGESSEVAAALREVAVELRETRRLLETRLTLSEKSEPRV